MLLLLLLLQRNNTIDLLAIWWERILSAESIMHKNVLFL
jgi:hypothetical protein